MFNYAFQSEISIKLAVRCVNSCYRKFSSMSRFIFILTLLSPINFTAVVSQSSSITASLCSFDHDKLGCNGVYTVEQWVCCSDGSIALPTPIEACKNEQWSGKCYGAQTNIALNKDISNNARQLIDGNRNSSVQLNANTSISWKIDLGKLYYVYAVVITLSQSPNWLELNVWVEFRFEKYKSLTHSCTRASSDSRVTKILFYCTLHPEGNDNGVSPGILSQDLWVSMSKFSQNILVTEIEAYENTGVECGNPDKSWRTTYTPEKQRYPLGAKVTYRCEREGYVMFGKKERECGVDGNWSGEVPLCRNVTLVELDLIGNKIPILQDNDNKTCLHPMVNKLNSFEYNFNFIKPVILYKISITTTDYARSSIAQKVDHDETFCKITANQSAFTNGTVHIEEKSSTIKVMQFTLTLAPNNPDARVSSAAIQCFGIVACEIKFEQLTDTNNCGEPGTPLHSTSVATQGGFNYSCNGTEYNLIGPNFRKCFSGVWRPSPAPSCKKMHCSNYPDNIPTLIGSGNDELVWVLENSSITVGSKALYYYKQDANRTRALIVATCKVSDDILNIKWTTEEIVIQSTTTTTRPEDQKDSKKLIYWIVVPSCIVGLLFIFAIGFLLYRRSRIINHKRLEAIKGLNMVYRSKAPARQISRGFSVGGFTRPLSTESGVYEIIDEIYDYDNLITFPNPAGRDNHLTLPKNPIPPEPSRQTDSAGYMVPICIDKDRKSNPVAIHRIQKF